MIGLDDMRRHALALPEVTEGTHFHMPSFKVADKSFANLEKDGVHMTVAVPQAEAAAAAAEDPDTYGELWRSGRIFVGLRVDLSNVSDDRVRALVRSAWRNKAPKRLVARYDDAR